jgi:hypothetical protein
MDIGAGRCPVIAVLIMGYIRRVAQYQLWKNGLNWLRIIAPLLLME